VAPPPSTFRLTPRPYQYEAVAALLAATARGVQRPLLVLPTGTGKTIVFALLVQRRRGRALILAHRDELIQQAVDKLRLWSWPHDSGHRWEAVSPHPSESFHGPENACGGPEFEQGKLGPTQGSTRRGVSDGTPLKFAPLLRIELDHLPLG
ncbi:MAG: DEAD/DEAH box helicase family protein, partial [Gemmatimonadales bacterium]